MLLHDPSGVAPVRSCPALGPPPPPAPAPPPADDPPAPPVPQLHDDTRMQSTATTRMMPTGCRIRSCTSKKRCCRSIARRSYGLVMPASIERREIPTEPASARRCNRLHIAAAGASANLPTQQLIDGRESA